MSTPLQDKHAQWRDRPSGASPVVDPGLAPPGTDEEAGGARAQPARETRPGDAGPLPRSASASNGGLRAPPIVWYGAAIFALLVLASAAIASF
jgi:hypothetical protein